VAVMRRHGLADLFHDIGRNRLRLYDDLPITRLAARDGALVDDWETGDAGAGRSKGYNTERPWRFLEPGAREAYAVAAALRDHFGPEQELAQLAAVCSAWAAGQLPNDVKTALKTLESAANGRNEEAPRGVQIAASTVQLARGCNNGCIGCPNTDHWQAEAPLSTIDTALRTSRPVLLTGREPTLHPDFLTLVRRARGGVGAVTNGRRFAYPAFSQAACTAGLRTVSLKLFGASAGVADAWTRAPGSHVQALAGARELKRAGLPHLELRLVLHRAAIDEAPDVAELAVALGADLLRVQLDIDAVGLDRLNDATRALGLLRSRCAALSIPLEFVPFGSGTQPIERMAN
jgi:pyruvate-formate lyase-activating enzyme